jgi:hypothetical protein
MNGFEWAVIAYFFVSALIGVRLFLVGKQIAKRAGVPIKLSEFTGGLFLDVIRWPYYLIWFGLKAFLADIR